MKDNSAKSGERLALFGEVPGSVKTPRRLYRDRAAVMDLGALRKDLEKESDRSLVILMAAQLDDALILCIVQHLCFQPTEDELKEIFRFEGPLGTFSSRTEIARLFGWIDETAYRQLDIIREMRNACAHSKQGIAFSIEALRNVTMRLFKPLGWVEVPELASEKGIRYSFMLECSHLTYAIVEGSEKADDLMLRSIMKRLVPSPSPDKPL